jgi:hypothetical protein
MENTVLEGVMSQLPNFHSNQIIKKIILHEYFKSYEVKKPTFLIYSE